MNTNDLSTATMLVTGGNTGIGLETAIGLAAMGSRVVITARDPERGATAVTEIRERTGNDRVDVLTLDLASFASIRSAARTFLDRYDRLDVLVNNAGIASAGQRWETAEGFEATFGVNHLGHFFLTNLLLDRLVASTPSRIVVVSSGAYPVARTGICFDDLQHEGDFHSMNVYAESKLANIYFTLVLAQRLAGSGVTVNALNPGYVATDLGRPRPEDLARATVKPQSANPDSDEMRSNLPPPMSAADGAHTSLLLATSREVEGVSGAYFSNGKLETLTAVGSDMKMAQQLWDESERLVGLHHGVER